MSTKYGFSSKDWEFAKEEILNILIEVAKKKRTISYSDLAEKIKTVKLEANSPGFHYMLGEISQDEDSLGHGLISVLVVHKHGDSQPGEGFYKLAEGRGRDVSDQMKFWVEELKKVYSYWKDK